MFYLTHRPKTIEEIDNSNVRDTIARVLSAPEIPHALLLVGQKGTGKTSVARIIASTINKTGDPEAASADIVELDAASNRGIDEIKNIIREASFVPLSGTYRVFIIDEAHMITTEGFNALLKTLEEPPQSAVFILATTNMEKLPQTIVSRCVVVEFGRAKKQDMIRMLTRIAQKEKLPHDGPLLEEIVKHSEHSFRDAAKLYEELSIQKKLTVDAAREYFGLRGAASLLQTLATNDIKGSLTWIETFVAGGGSIKNLIESSLEDLRLLLLAKNGVHTDDDAEDVALSLPDISRLIRLLSDAYSMLRTTPVESLALEIAVADFYNERVIKSK